MRNRLIFFPPLRGAAALPFFNLSRSIPSNPHPAIWLANNPRSHSGLFNSQFYLLTYYFNTFLLKFMQIFVDLFN
ncbi:MAG TPA: hypothetical protein DCZ55_35560 [Cyanobacteria bacterium UBA11371]|nr:hypothetical protein [Cyanobacteria bacterium UBA11371]